MKWIFDPDEQWEDCVRQVAKDIDEGLYEEMDLVSFIIGYLINAEEVMWMSSQDLHVADLLNGRFSADQSATVQAIFTDWNLKCRRKIFKLGRV